MSEQVQLINTADLKEHPLNHKLYGRGVSDEFVEDCRHGIIEAIHCTPELVVFSGHRRLAAAIRLGIDKVRVIVHDDLYDEDEIQRLLVTLNKQRIKTKDQIAREAALLMDVERRASLKRRDRFGPLDEGETTGRADDAVGKEVGLSRSSAADAAIVGKAIFEAEEAGDFDRAEDIKISVNEHGFKNAARMITPKGRRQQVENCGATKEYRDVKKKYGEFMRSLDSLLHAYNKKRSRFLHRRVRELMDRIHKELDEWSTLE